VQYISSALQRADVDIANESTIATIAPRTCVQARISPSDDATANSDARIILLISQKGSLSLSYERAPSKLRASAGTRNARRVHNSSRARRMRTLSRGFTTGANHADMNYARAVSYETRVARARASERTCKHARRGKKFRRPPSTHRSRVRVRGPPSRVFTRRVSEGVGVEHAGSKDAAARVIVPPRKRRRGRELIHDRGVGGRKHARA